MRFFLLFLFSVPVFAAVEQRTFDSKGLREVVVRNSSGSIHFLGSNESKAEVEIDKSEYSESCELSIERNGPTLYVESRNKKAFDATCNANLRFKVPQQININVRNGQGALSVRDTFGALSFEIGKGDAEVQAALSSLSGKVGNGDITARSLRAGAKLKTGMGDVRLFYDHVPTEGSLQVSTGKGDTSVYLPATARVSAKLRSVQGDVSSDFGNSARGFPVKLQTAFGNLSLKRKSPAVP